MPTAIRGLRCPSCRQQGKVRSLNMDKKEGFTLRYRRCDECGHRFKTHEYVVVPSEAGVLKEGK